MKIIDKLVKNGVGLTPLASRCSIPLMVLLVAFLFSSSEIVAQQSERNFSASTYENVLDAIGNEALEMRQEARNASPDSDLVAHYLGEYYNNVWTVFTQTADIEHAFFSSAEIFQSASSTFQESGFYETLFPAGANPGGSAPAPALTITGDDSGGVENLLNSDFVDLVEDIDLSRSSYLEKLNLIFGYLQSIR